MAIKRDTTLITDAISQIDFTGNVTPVAWYTAITVNNPDTGKPMSDVIAITLLSELVTRSKFVNVPSADFVTQSAKFLSEPINIIEQAVARLVDAKLVMMDEKYIQPRVEVILAITTKGVV
ncbi:MAG: hypothetical protein BWK73_09170 [Thiothrix lacustris]|uniref:Uncharacterized protein n=1 Tax=Thiothrix lacustris TaxID=525917 RepID=A0A1Y1QV22_9GAMM|nr:MAG: hypothetical protein BWK73_09170 [Thiothrix lacustris]